MAVVVKNCLDRGHINRVPIPHSEFDLALDVVQDERFAAAEAPWEAASPAQVEEAREEGETLLGRSCEFERRSERPGARRRKRRRARRKASSIFQKN